MNQEELLNSLEKVLFEYVKEIVSDRKKATASELSAMTEACKTIVLIEQLK